MANSLPRLICSITVSLFVVGGLYVASPSPGYADPPPWAPAHGWRRKHDGRYTG